MPREVPPDSSDRVSEVDYPVDSAGSDSFDRDLDPSVSSDPGGNIPSEFPSDEALLGGDGESNTGFAPIDFDPSETVIAYDPPLVNSLEGFQPAAPSDVTDDALAAGQALPDVAIVDNERPPSPSFEPGGTDYSGGAGEPEYVAPSGGDDAQGLEVYRETDEANAEEAVVTDEDEAQAAQNAGDTPVAAQDDADADDAQATVEDNAGDLVAADEDMADADREASQGADGAGDLVVADEDMADSDRADATVEDDVGDPTEAQEDLDAASNEISLGDDESGVTDGDAEEESSDTPDTETSDSGSDETSSDISTDDSASDDEAETYTPEYDSGDDSTGADESADASDAGGGD
jgi:hypothetical protein